MKKIVKLALVVSMFVAMCMTSVSAATYKTKGTIINDISITEMADGTLAIELPVGTYVSGTYEVGAHFIKFANTSGGTDKGMTTVLSPADSEPWYLLASFTLTSAEVSKLASSKVTKKVTPDFEYGASNIRVVVGSGNYNKYAAGGTITITPTTSGSGPSTTDLAEYSLFNMNVYKNSRVTSVKSSGNGFVVNGYMFEAEANTPSTLWREIVFVNVNDYSKSAAYRKQCTSIYNTWLNKNATATSNYKYTLNYANYSVTVNPYDMNLYATNTSGYRMASGTYYMYMRISNGNTSYLFPLCDVTLSDGTNMENTGTLPSGFAVYDKTTRALTYTMK